MSSRWTPHGGQNVSRGSKPQKNKVHSGDPENGPNKGKLSRHLEPNG